MDRIERAKAASIDRARFTAASGASLTLSLPGTALGITRTALDRILFDHAAACGAEAIERAEVRAIEKRGDRFEIHLKSREIVTARYAIGAYGRRARIDLEMSRRFTEERHPYVGFKRHHRPTEGARTLEGSVEIHALDGGYCGMSFVESGEVNVCMLLEQRFVDRLPDTDWSTIQRALAGANRHLAGRLSALIPSGDAVHAVAEIPFSLKERAKNGVLFVGDAAGMIAPLAGDGQAMALDSAVMLAETMGPFSHHPSERDLETLARRWDLRWRLAFEPRMRIAKRLQDLLFDPVGADRAIRWIGGVPGLAPLLARLTRGSTRARA